MKFTAFILLLPFISVFSQEIEYTLFIKNPCSNTIQKEDFYHLEKDSLQYFAFDFENNTIILPSFGEYNLVASRINGEVHKVKIDKKINSDTLLLPIIEEYQITHNKFGYRFDCCGKKCRGIKTDYYSNGSTRTVGKFRKGLVVGELKKFYQNGNLKELSIYNKKGVLQKTTLFDENGKIKNE